MLLNQRFYHLAVRRNQYTRALRYKASKMAYNTETGDSAPAPWHAKYPPPKSEAGGVSREEVLRMLCSAENSASKDFVLIDLRRNDYEVST